MRVADPFHVVRVANRCVDKVRRRVQNETLGHRGRKADPLYRIRKLLALRLRAPRRARPRAHAARAAPGGSPRRAARGLAGQGVGARHLPDRAASARPAHSLRKAIVGCKGDEVAEIRSLGDTLERWQTEILNHHRTGASNGPDRRAEPVREEDQARRPWLLLLRALPLPRPPPCWRCDLAQASVTASDQNPRSLRYANTARPVLEEGDGPVCSNRPDRPSLRSRTAVPSLIT